MDTQKPSRFKQFHNREITGLGSFESTLYDLFYKADQGNRKRLVTAFLGKYFEEDDINF